MSYFDVVLPDYKQFDCMF